MTKIDTLIRQFEADIRRAVLEEALEKALHFAPSFHVIQGQPTLTARGRDKLTNLRKGEKRTPATLDEHRLRLLAAVRNQPGEGIEALARFCGLTTRELRLPMDKLLEAYAVKAKGVKRATKYFPVNRAGAR